MNRALYLPSVIISSEVGEGLSITQEEFLLVLLLPGRYKIICEKVDNMELQERNLKRDEQ